MVLGNKQIEDFKVLVESFDRDNVFNNTVFHLDFVTDLQVLYSFLATISEKAMCGRDLYFSIDVLVMIVSDVVSVEDIGRHPIAGRIDTPHPIAHFDFTDGFGAFLSQHKHIRCETTLTGIVRSL